MELSVAGKEYWRMVPLAVLTLTLWFAWLRPRIKKQNKEE